jgi:hypothetical protein
MITRAEQRAADMGILNNSILNGEGSAAGFLAEEAVSEYISVPIENHKDYDLILPDGSRAEVKTKQRSVFPLDSYDVSVADTSRFQKPDTYIFVSLHYGEKIMKNRKIEGYKDLKAVWLLGQKTLEAYFKLATFWPKGKVDPTNGFVTRADMWNLPINKLDPIPTEYSKQQPLLIT